MPRDSFCNHRRPLSTAQKGHGTMWSSLRPTLAPGRKCSGAPLRRYHQARHPRRCRCHRLHRLLPRPSMCPLSSERPRLGSFSSRAWLWRCSVARALAHSPTLGRLSQNRPARRWRRIAPACPARSQLRVRSSPLRPRRRLRRRLRRWFEARDQRPYMYAMSRDEQRKATKEKCR